MNKKIAIFGLLVAAYTYSEFDKKLNPPPPMPVQNVTDELNKPTCFERGVAYYKEIGSYPTLSTGEDAKERIRGMCSRSKIAFGTDDPALVATAHAGAQGTNQTGGLRTSVGRQWQYDANEDAMTGKTQYTAIVESSNTVNFGFPYNGDQHGRLTMRIHPQHGKDVIFRIQKGQLLCPSYEGCNVQVRFDEGKPVRFAASGAADHSTEVVFINDYTGFISRLKKSKRVRVAVDIYQNGRPVFDFDVSGFDPKKYQPKS